jgi:hypothetical protein
MNRRSPPHIFEDQKAHTKYELVLRRVTGKGRTEDTGYHYFDVLKK